MSDVLDTIRATGHIAQLQVASDGMWVSWTQFTKGTPEENRANALTLVQRKLEANPDMWSRGRVVRADWIVEEVIDPPATDSAAVDQAEGDRENGDLNAEGEM